MELLSPTSTATPSRHEGQKDLRLASSWVPPTSTEVSSRDQQASGAPRPQAASFDNAQARGSFGNVPTPTVTPTGGTSKHIQQGLISPLHQATASRRAGSLSPAPMHHHHHVQRFTTSANMYPSIASPKLTHQQCRPLQVSGGSYVAPPCPGCGVMAPAVSTIPPPQLLSARTTLREPRSHSATRSASTLPTMQMSNAPGGTATVPMMPPTGYITPSGSRAPPGHAMQAPFGAPGHVIMPPRVHQAAVVRRPSKRSDGSSRDEAEDQKITVEKIKTECKDIAEAAAEAALKKAQAASLPTGRNELLDALNNITASQQQTREHVVEDSRKTKELQEEVNRWRSRSDHNENQLGIERANTESLHKQLQASQGQQRRLEEQLEVQKRQQLEVQREQQAAPVPSRHEDEATIRRQQLQLEQMQQQLQQHQRKQQQLQQRLGEEQEERERLIQRCQEQERIMGQQAASSSNNDAAAQEKHTLQRKAHDLQEYVKQLEEQLWQEREERKMDKITTPEQFLAMYKATEKQNLSHENCQLKVDNSRLRSDLEKCLEKLKAQANMPRGSIGGS